MASVDEDLRHRGTAAAALDHLGAARRINHDIDFRELDALLLQQLLRAVAVAAEHAGIDFDFGHDSNGSPVVLPIWETNPAISRGRRLNHAPPGPAPARPPPPRRPGARRGRRRKPWHRSS